MCPREFTRSFGFWNSGVLKNGDGVRTGGILGSSSWRRKGVPGVNGFGESVNITLLMGVWGGPGSSVFLFRALDRLKLGVGKGGDELLVRMAEVLVTSGDKSCVGPGDGGGEAARPGLASLCAEVSFVDDVGVAVPDAVVIGAGFRGAWLLGVR